MRNIKGFTIIEVLISSAIIAVLILVAFTVLDIGRGSWFGSDVQVEIRNEITRGFMGMERELRETRPVSAQMSINYGESANLITFKIPTIDANGVVLDAFGYIVWSSNIVYALNGNNEIIRTDANGLTRVLARNITSLQFSRSRIPALPQDLLIINITARKASDVGKLATETGQLIIRMRN